MPFGLTNAPVTFQALKNNIFAKYLGKFIIVFFDDILVFSKSKLEHLDHLRIALEILRRNHLFAKRSKCLFGIHQVDYLSHIISREGVTTDPKKIEDIINWPRPTDLTKLRSFLGLTGYRFVKGYEVICRPLFDLMKNNSFQ